ELPLTRWDSISNASPAVVQKLYYVATKDTKTGNVFLKVVNVEKEPQKVAVSIEGKSKVQSKALKVELKGDSPTATNTIDNPENIIPVKSETKVGKNFTYTFPPYSITMLQINTHN
ncbi:MAG: hypothetical protein LBH19_10020, partial [Dysgonamonadaceae bacterium]|nr:hypothetical protein [Dysgonamonadaceae bacterium]